MFRTHYLAAAVGLPLLFASCGEDTVPPSGPRVEPPRPAARVSASAVDRFRIQIRELGANALFSSVDPSGCVETDAFVFGAEQTRKEGPGKPTTGPLASVVVLEFNFCTNELLRSIFGETGDATITASDFLNGVEVQVVADLTWTGAGELASLSDRFRLKAPGFLVSQWFKGTFRPAAVSGTVAIAGENVATNAHAAEIFRARSGEFESADPVTSAEPSRAQQELSRSGNGGGVVRVW